MMGKCENQATLICIVDEGCPKKVTNRRKVNFTCQFVPSRPVQSRPVHPDHHDHHDHHDQHDQHDRGDHDDNGDHEEERSNMRKLEVAHKEVGGCAQGSWRLSDQMRIAASIALTS